MLYTEARRKLQGSLRLLNLRVVPAHVVHLNCHLAPHSAVYRGLYNCMILLTEGHHKCTCKSWRQTDLLPNLLMCQMWKHMTMEAICSRPNPCFEYFLMEAHTTSAVETVLEAACKLPVITMDPHPSSP